jgi:hypothetical protein
MTPQPIVGCDNYNGTVARTLSGNVTLYGLVNYYNVVTASNAGIGGFIGNIAENAVVRFVDCENRYAGTPRGNTASAPKTQPHSEAALSAAYRLQTLLLPLKTARTAGYFYGKYLRDSFGGTQRGLVGAWLSTNGKLSFIKCVNTVWSFQKTTPRDFSPTVLRLPRQILLRSNSLNARTRER